MRKSRESHGERRNKIKKDNLKTGMVVEMRDGCRGVVLKTEKKLKEIAQQLEMSCETIKEILKGGENNEN